MNEPKFSIVCIMRNEEKTLPRCAESLKEFLSRGGEWLIVDTGSTDNSAKLAKELGAKVFEVGEKFITTIGQNATDLNERFVVEGEEPIVRAGNRLFDFAAARNYATSLAKNDMVCTLDIDEAYSVLNIDRLNQLIADGWEQFEYQFVFAHDWMGNPAVQFVQSKFFDRRKVRWEGVVHEVLQGEAKHMLLGPEVILLEHWQLPGGEHRGNYLVGLAVDCFNHPDKDRQSHYLARELMWTGHPKSALKEFERHVAMKDRWPVERAQSIIFMGDCYGMLNMPDKQASMYVQAFIADPNRREALIKLARFYLHNKQYQQVVTCVKAALEIPWTDYYANDKGMYEEEPHFLLYTAYGWLGNIPEAQKEIMICLDYQRENPRFMNDTKYYFEYPANFVAGWFSFKEQQFIYNTAKKMESMIELGSWKGKSTHAACSSGCPRVVAIDTWKGSEFEPQAHAEARSGAVYEEFIKNVGHFKNLTIIKNDINLVVDSIPDKSVDMVFIDAGHTYEEVKNDIRKWKNKARIVLCGHDYCTSWAGVKQAVDEELGGPDEIHDSIWVKWLNKPLVSICIPTLGRPEKLHRLLQGIEQNAGYNNFEVIVKSDEFPPNNVGAPTMLARCVNASTGDLVCFLGNDCIPQPGFLREAVWEMARRFPDMDGMVGLNDGYWRPELGHVSPHWLCSKKLLPLLNRNEFFDTEFYHTGVDNILQGQCENLGKYTYTKTVVLNHDHPMLGGKKEDMDELYAQAYSGPRHDHDDKLYAQRVKELGIRKF